MSTKNGLGKLYDRLTPEERFKLDVEAMARGDKEESRRLVDTCPRLNYNMTDVQFSGRWNGTIQLTMAALMDFRHTIAKLRMIEAFRVALPYARTLAQNDAADAYYEGHETGSRYAWSKAGRGGDPPGWEADEEEAEENVDPQIEEDVDKIEAGVDQSASLIPGLLERLERELATQALGVWVSFSGFCEEDMDLPAGKILAALFPLALEDVMWLRELCERLEIEAEEAAVEECRETLAEHWQRHIRRG
jgi:hypothetical protein